MSTRALKNETDMPNIKMLCVATSAAISSHIKGKRKILLLHTSGTWY